MATARPQAKKVFISYCQKDRAWLEQLQVFLKPLERNGVVVWDDTRLKPGELWKDVIEEGIASTHVAVVLASEHYDASDFIADVELPLILAAERDRGLVVMPVILSPCRFEKTPGLARFSAINHGLKPLVEMTEAEQKKLWKRLADAIEETLNRSSATPSPQGVRWNVPPRNPHFTGRKEVLNQLGAALKKHRGAALLGMPGVGKTQTAFEYAHQHREEYEAVLWVSADSPETLISGYSALARLLGLPQRDEADQAVIVAAVRRWLDATPGWLLILDNADNLAAVRDLLPTDGPGHRLLTTRDPAVQAVAPILKVDKMAPEEGARLLLVRSGRLAADAPLKRAGAADQKAALALSREVDGLPLALDQAGAYLVENQVSPAEYLELYKAEGAKLRAERGVFDRDHASVSVTFALALAKVESTSPATADLLRLAALLAPEPIPEDIFREGAPDLGDRLGPACASQFTFITTTAVAHRLSLLHRDSESRTLTIHRLVQDVIRDTMDDEMHRLWAERAVRAVDRAYPGREHTDWPAWERLLPHAMSCFVEVEKWGMVFPEAGRLLDHTGYYLTERARYAEAEPHYRRALAIFEASGPVHPNTARCLSGLGRLYWSQGRLSEAEPLFHRALEIGERVFGPDHPDTVIELNNLASLCNYQERYSEAVPLFQRALEILERLPRPNHSNKTILLNNMAYSYNALSRHAEAESLYRRALEIDRNELGPEHPHTALVMNNLAELLRVQLRYTEAEPLFLQALEIDRNVLGPDHPQTAQCLHNLALLYSSQGPYAEAETLFQLAITINEKVFGPDHPETTLSLQGLAELYRLQGRYAEAEPLFQRALAIREKALGSDHPDTARNLNNLAHLHNSQGRYAEAEPLYRRALAIREKALGPDHPHTANSLNNLALLYDSQGQYAEAEPLFQRALAIREKVLGPDHPDTAQSLNNLAILYYSRGRYAEAEPLYRRALAICEKASGPDHPHVAIALDNLADVLGKTDRQTEADGFRARAQAIRDQRSG